MYMLICVNQQLKPTMLWLQCVLYFYCTNHNEHTSYTQEMKYQVNKRNEGYD